MQKILSKMRKCIEDFSLIEDGDKIAIGVSGGKDSLTLLTAFSILKKFYPKKFDIVGISIDLFDGKSDFTKIQEYCNELGVEFHVVKSDINNVVFNIRKESNPCSLCAKMRRGALNNAAIEFGCNKVALGHHSDDLIETFFLSMFYEGRLSTFSPKTYLSNTKITVIRPLIYVEEKETIRVSKNMPIMNNCCLANHNTQREWVKKLLKNLKKEIPFIKDRIFSAITHEERYNLNFKKDDEN